MELLDRAHDFAIFSNEKWTKQCRLPKLALLPAILRHRRTDALPARVAATKGSPCIGRMTASEQCRTAGLGPLAPLAVGQNSARSGLWPQMKADAQRLNSADQPAMLAQVGCNDWLSVMPRLALNRRAFYENCSTSRIDRFKFKFRSCGLMRGCGRTNFEHFPFLVLFSILGNVVVLALTDGNCPRLIASSRKAEGERDALALDQLGGEAAQSGAHRAIHCPDA